MSDKIPTTDDYKVGVDIDLSAARSLSDKFTQASKGGTLDKFLPKFLRSVTRDDEVTVNVNEDALMTESQYHPLDKTFSVGLKESGIDEKLAAMFKVDKQNFPPNIPKELTPELFDLGVLLHEAEHNTQSGLPKTEDGKFDRVNITSNVVKPDAPITAFGDGHETILEMDADRAPVAFFQAQGMKDSAQFLLDMKEVNFNRKGHDTATMQSHYEETGEVIDPAHYEKETASLYTDMKAKVGVDNDKIVELLNKYPPETLDRAVKDPSFINKLNSLDAAVTPQKLMYGAIKMLEGDDKLKGDDQLEGVARLKVENYLAAMDRLGYKPDPSPVNGLEQATAAIEQIHNSVQQNSPESENSLSEPSQNSAFGLR